MSFTELFDQVSKNPLMATIVGTIVSAIIISLSKGFINYLRGKSFKRGLFWLFRLSILSMKWIFLKVFYPISIFFKWLKGKSILFLKFLLKPVIIEILKELEKVDLDNTLLADSNSNINIFSSEHGDEVFYPIDFDLNMFKNVYEIKLVGFRGSYWRIGLKLSSDGKFPDTRHAHNHPLIHLTKNHNESTLKIDYFNIKNEHEIKEEPIYNSFFDDNIIIRFTGKGGSGLYFVVIINEKRVYSNYLNEKKFGFAKLFAWADGYPFEIKAQINTIFDAKNI